MWRVAGSPVEGVEHLNGDQHGQSHGHGLGGVEDVAVHTLEHLGLGGALHVVGLPSNNGGQWPGNAYMAVSFFSNNYRFIHTTYIMILSDKKHAKKASRCKL